MALPIFYTEQSLLPDFLILNEDTSRHIVQVLRMKRGETIELTDGKGNMVVAVVEDDHKKRCTVRVLDRANKQKPQSEISIGISLLKNSARFEWFLEKATEIGVNEIVPMICDRTEKQHFRLDRMLTIVTTAMLQSQQYWLPKLHEPKPYHEVVTGNNYVTRLIAHCEQEAKKELRDFVHSPCLILIGPEGDFRRSEIELAFANKFQPVTLGVTRLRSETAGVVAASMLCLRR